MADKMDGKTIAPGAKVNAVVTESRMPDKKSVIVTMAAGIFATWIKWFEVHTGYNIPTGWEIALTTFMVALVAYATPERLTVVTTFLGFNLKKITLVDVVSFIATGVIVAAIKTYETIYNTDVPAEQEFLIIPAFVGFFVSLVKTKNVVVTSAQPIT